MRSDNINFVFFEEYKKLEKLCNDMYDSHNGVTNYIDDMKAISYDHYRNIPDWELVLKQLKRLRHIRNTLAHEEDAFERNISSQNDIEWLRVFYQCILDQSDPLAVQRRNLKHNTQAKETVSADTLNLNTQSKQSIPIDTESHNENEEKDNIPLITTILIVSIVMILTALCVLYACFY